MGNSSAFGSLARKAIVWIIVAAVAILVFKFVVARRRRRRVDAVRARCCSALVAYAVIWAVRKL